MKPLPTVPTNFARKPRKPVLTLNAVKGKDGVAGVRVFPDAHVFSLFPYEKKRS
jgi:hypothetical protein